MAFLLGNESCIESLRSDLGDIQETIDEILNRNGPIKCYSWKSPDKLVTDLQIKDLLERYKYGKDEVDNQVAHYSLLELIIDRLLLLIYLSSNYAEASLSESNGTSNTKVARLNAGLSIKKYWNKYTQLCTTLRQLNCQNKSLMAKQKNTEDLRSSQTIHQTTSNTGHKSNNINGKSVNINANVNQNTKKISEEVSSKSVQTQETAFVPCESCAKVQTNLKQNADQIINMCHYQNIASQVGKFRTSLMANQLIGGWLNGPDLEKWLIEQDKDLNKIAKQLEFLSKNNELLKTKMAENEASVEKMANSEKEMKKTLKEEQELRSITMKQYEKKMNDQKVELQAKINSLENDIKNFNQLKISLEEKYESLKNLNDNNEKIIVELNETNKTLAEEVQHKNDQKQKIQKLEEEKLILNTEFECLKRELNEKTNDLNNERTKLDNSIRTEQSLKLKYETLLESIDKLTVESENLKKKLTNNDDEKSNYKHEKEALIESIKSKEIEIENLKYDNQILQNSINSLKQDIKKMKENETLLIRYPDLYGPLEQLNENELNVCEDMINQINANKYRISLLESLNKKLNNSIKKLNETQMNNISNNEIENNEHNIYINKSNSVLNKYENGHDNDTTNYFMKPPPSTRTNSNVTTPKASALTRPVPLFKLENEIDEIGNKPPSSSHGLNESTKSLSKKYWNQNESLTKENTSNIIKSSSSDHSINIMHNDSDITTRDLNTPKLFDKNHVTDKLIDSDNDEDYDFLKDKRESDKGFLEKLNQINQTSELRIENTEFNYMKNRRNISSRAELNSPFLYSPSQSSLNSEPRTANQSRASNHSAINRKTPIIPPADKNLEVIVGKGRRSSISGSSRSNSASAKPNIPTGANNSARAKTNLNTTGNTTINNNKDLSRNLSYKCENCEKQYNNIKDLDIHKLYCDKK